MDRIFRFHCIAREWRECTFAEMTALHMMNLPAGLVPTCPGSGLPAPYPEQVYCIRHRAFERMEECDGYVAKTDAGCKLECCAIPQSISKDKETYWAPMYWRIRQEKPDSPVMVSASFAIANMLHELLDWRYMEYSYQLREGGFSITSDKKDGFTSPHERFSKEGVVLPDVVTDVILDRLRDNAAFIYGFRPSILSRMQGLQKILAFLDRPLDLNISYLRKFIGEDFDKLFPCDATDNFRPLCEYLGIRPSKSLRKAYTFNPYAVVWHVLLRQFGAHDVNLMQQFYGFDNGIANFFLSKFVYCKETGLVGRQEADEAYRWKCIEFYFRWIIANRGEKVFVHRLLKMTQEGVSDSEQEAIKTFYAYYRSLSPSVKDEILEHGMTSRIRQVIEKEIARIGKAGMTFHYSPKEIAYEDSVAGVAFRLVPDTEELYEIGRIMHNCVGDYREEIACGESLLMTASVNGDYCACLEIQNGSVVQAKAPCNERPSDDIGRVICYWSILHKLELDTEDIEMREEYLQEMQTAADLSRRLTDTILPRFSMYPLSMTLEISEKIEEAVKYKALQMMRLSEEDAESLEEYGDDDNPDLIALGNAKALSRTLIMLAIADELRKNGDCTHAG